MFAGIPYISAVLEKRRPATTLMTVARKAVPIPQFFKTAVMPVRRGVGTSACTPADKRISPGRAI